MIEESDIDKYHEVLHHVHERESELILKHEKVVKRSIDWDTLGAAYLDENDLSKIKKFDEQKKKRIEYMTKDGKTYARILLTLLSKAQEKKFLQYIITLCDDIIKDDVEIIYRLWELRDLEIPGVSKLPLGPLMRLLNHKSKDWYLRSKACSVLSTLFIHIDEIPEEDQRSFFYWISDQLIQSSVRYVFNALTTLKILLRREKYRKVFYKEEGLNSLITIANAHQTDSQILYLTIYCLWDLSYHPKVKKKMTDPVLISNLVEILKNTKMVEKVIRLTLATLKNILNIEKNNELMISYGIMRCLMNFRNKKWGDEEIEADLEILHSTLEKKIHDLTSFDIYKNELLSKKLDWNTPSHKLETFWKSNIYKFDEDEYKVARILSNILKDDKVSPSVLAVACWDAGELVRHHPNKKFLLMNVDFKSDVMNLLNHSDEEVQREALRALQKIMVTNFDLLV